MTVLRSQAEEQPLADGTFVANLRRLTSATALGEKQRQEFVAAGRWPLRAYTDVAPAVLTTAQAPRSTGVSAQVLLTLLLRFDDMSDSTTTVTSPKEKG